MNIQSQKGMGLPVVLLIVAIAIAGGAVYYFMGQQKEGGVKTDEKMEEKMMEKSVQVSLMSQNNSGESGEAMITEVDGKAKVVLSLTGAPSGVSQPAHIHLKSCDDLGGVKYPLTNVVNGSSQTMLEVSIDEILSGRPVAINVHKSGAEAGIYVSCGDISPTNE